MQNKYISEEAYYNSMNKNPVYVVLMNGGTPLSKIISGFTGDTYTHACISFNAKLKPLYSFGLTNDSTFGFAVANPRDKKAFPHIDKYAVYVMYVSNHQLYKMKKRLKWFIDNGKDLKFDFPALVSVFFQKDTENHSDKYFCSRFVAEILKMGEVDLEKKASLYRPESLLALSNISLVNWGRDIIGYNWIKTRDNERLIKQNRYVHPTSLIPKFESGGNDLYEETHWDTLLTKPKLYFNKKVTMYHYSNTNKDIVVPLTVNAGNKLAKPRFSSWWTPYKSNAGWALSYVIFNTFKESKWKDVLWHVETITIDGMTYRAPRTIISESFYKSHEDFIKSIDVYEHQKTFNGSDLGRGNEYSVDEYTCDFAVKPDRVRRISWDEMLEIIKIVPDDEFQLYRKELNDMWVHGKTFQDLVHEKKPWLYWEFDVSNDIRARYCKEHNIQFKIDEEYFRFTYHGGGIYEELKQHVSPNVWIRLLSSSNFKWLPKPDYYSDTCTSWFTKEGKDQFIKKVLPICEKYLGDEVEYAKVKDLKNIVYKDKYQVIVDPIINTNESAIYDNRDFDAILEDSFDIRVSKAARYKNNTRLLIASKEKLGDVLKPKSYKVKGKQENFCILTRSIDHALMMLGEFCLGREYFIYQTEDIYDLYNPKDDERIYPKCVSEVWIKSPVKISYMKKIKVIKDMFYPKYKNNPPEDIGSINNLYAWNTIETEVQHDSTWIKESGSTLNKSSNPLLNNIIEFNAKTNVMEYIIPNNGNIITKFDYKTLFTKYRVLSPEKFKKYNGGICWDYVIYESYYFNKNFRNVPYKAFYHSFINDRTNPAHTFILFYLSGKVYWFESSLKDLRGVYEFANEIDALSYITRELYSVLDSSTRIRIRDSFLTTYNPLDITTYNMTLEQYTDYMFTKPKYEYVKKNNPKYIRKYLGTEEFDIDQYQTESKSNNQIYFISDKNMDDEVLLPRIPDNYFTRHGYEDTKTKRVCFTPSIDKSLMALSNNITGKEFYVHIAIGDYKVYKPTVKQVPDSKITGELWVTKPVKVSCIGKIKVISDMGLSGHKFSYGDKEAELYDWKWEWVEKLNSVVEMSDYKLEETMLYEFANKELLDKIHVTSDVELSKWMKSNIKYQEFKTLMTPEEVFESRMGSCHDQVVFELAVLKALKYSPKALFFIEYNDGDNVGGQTHSFVYYRRGTKFYWFENAWGGQAGIHGPYKNVKELKNDIISKHDTKKYKKLQFASFKGKEGMTLDELVKACLK